MRAVAAPNPQERRFWIALACAAVVHAVLIFGATRSLPRQMGEKSGRPDGISVELVEAADLRSKNTFATDGGPPAQPLPPAKQAARAIEEQDKAVARSSPKEAPELAPAPDQAPRQEAKQQKQEAPLWPLDRQALEFVPPPDPGNKRSEPEPPAAAKPAPAPKAQPKPAPPLQLKLPDTAFVPSDISAGFARPAGITRSGENDEFGRGVIRALRKTMPPGGPQPGRVTVRFLLSDYGNLIELRLERGSGDPALDQSVMFAVKQASFPFPPPKAPPVDRTFLVTYVYR